MSLCYDCVLQYFKEKEIAIENKLFYSKEKMNVFVFGIINHSKHSLNTHVLDVINPNKDN